jgi:hypothetical protein
VPNELLAIPGCCAASTAEMLKFLPSMLRRFAGGMANDVAPAFRTLTFIV